MMERTEAHDFYLLKMEKDIRCEDIDIQFIDRTKYVILEEFWIHDDFMCYLYPSFSGLSVKIQYIGITLITSKKDAEKLIRICAGWESIIQEMDEVVIINGETSFKKEDLLEWIKSLKIMAKKMTENEDYIIYYAGI